MRHHADWFKLQGVKYARIRWTVLRVYVQKDGTPHIQPESRGAGLSCKNGLTFQREKIIILAVYELPGCKLIDLVIT